MNRTTKKVLALAVSAAMVFSVGFSAFAEQATPETAQQNLPTNSSAAVQTNVDTSVAMLTVAYHYNDGSKDDVTKTESYTDLQTALNALESYQFEGEADGVYRSFSLALVQDVTGSFTVPACTANIVGNGNDSLPILDLNGHTITATNGPALTLEAGALLSVTDNGGTPAKGCIAGGQYSAIYAKETNRSTLWIQRGTYTSDTETPIQSDAGYGGVVQVSGGRFSSKLDSNLLTPDVNNVTYTQAQGSDGYWEVTMNINDNFSQVAKDASGNTYPTVQAAMNAGKGQVTLLQDTKESIRATSSLDFNGHTLTAADDNEYAIYETVHGVHLIDSLGGGGTIGGVRATGFCTIEGGTYKAKNGCVLDSNSANFQIFGGTFIGSDKAPVIYASGNEDMANAVIFNAEIRAGNGQPIFGKSDAVTKYSFTVQRKYTQSKPLALYGNLGLTDPEHLRLCGGSYDHEPPASCLYTEDSTPYKIEKNGDMWEIVQNFDAYTATVTFSNGTVKGFSGLQEALTAAVEDKVNNNTTYGTVTLRKDVTENITASTGGKELNNSDSLTLNLDGHTLTAADPAKPAVKLDGVRMKLTGKENVSQPAATINGTIETNVYLWLTLTTVNAPAGQPAINYTGTTDNDMSVKGRSVINGAAGQPAIVANAEVHIGDDSKIHAGENGVLFAKGAKAAADAKCFFLDMTTLYGNLGDEAAVNAIEINVGSGNGKCFTKFDREPPESIIPQGYKVVKNGDLYELQIGSVGNVVDKEQNVATTVDTAKTEVPTVSGNNIPANLMPTKEEAVKKAEEIKNELTDSSRISAEVRNFKDNNLANTVNVTGLPNVKADSTVTLYVAVELQDIQLSANATTDEKGNVTAVTLGSKTLKFDVTPMAQVDSNDPAKIENSLLNGNEIVFRLPIPAAVGEKYAVVTHEGDAPRYIEIATDAEGKKYIEIRATHFSVFTVNFTNTLPESDNTGNAAAPAATQAPAKNDGKNIYYTCVACGYHDWTATAEGYKCDHCGHIESVKQLAGYSNVKGVYEPKTSTAAAAAKKTVVKSSTIPQTSDDMPVAAITVVALAALLGFGITAVRKFRG